MLFTLLLSVVTLTTAANIDGIIKSLEDNNLEPLKTFISENDTKDQQRLFKELTLPAAEILMSWVLGKSLPEWRAERKRLLPQNALEQTLTIETPTLSKMDASVCSFFLEFRPNFSNLEHLPRECIKAYFEKLSPTQKCQLRYILPEWAELEPRSLVSNIGTTTWEGHRKLSHKVLLRICKNPSNVCDILSLKFFRATRYLLFESITPKCFSQLRDLEADIEDVDELQESIFSHYDGPLSERTLQLVKPHQFRLFGMALEQPFVCSRIDITQVTQWPQLVTAKCLLGYISQGKSLGSGWQGLSMSTQMEILPVLSQVFTNLSDKDYKHLPARVIEACLFSSELVAMLRQKQKINLFNKIDLDERKFAKLASESLIGAIEWALVVEKIKVDILMLVTPELLSRLLSTPEFVSALSRKRPSAFANLSKGRKVHFCATIDLSWYTESLALRRYGGPQCTNALHFKNNELVFEKLSEFGTAQGIDHLRTKSLDFWGTDGVILLLKLLKSDPSEWILEKAEAIGRFTNPELFWMIDGAVVKYFIPWITPNLARQLRTDAYIDFTYEDFISLGSKVGEPVLLDHLSDQHVLLLSFNVSKETNFYTHCPPDTLAKLFARDITPTGRNFWNAIGERIDTLPPELLQSLTASHVHALAKFVTPDNAKHFGTSAFGLFTSDDFHNLVLEDLSPAQRKHLSEHVLLDQHYFFHLTIEEANNLSEDILATISGKQLKWLKAGQRFREAKFVLRQAMAKKLSGGNVYTPELLQRIADALTDLSAPGISKESFDAFGWQDEFLKDLNHLKLTNAAHDVAASFRTFVGLGFLNSNDSKSHLLRHRFGQAVAFDISNDGSTFDLKAFYDYILSYPDNVVDSNFKLQSPGMFDAGGPIRGLIGQSLEDIKNRFTIPIDNSAKRKFSWLLSRCMGPIIGMLVAKALQKDILLPFELDAKFYSLIINPTDEKIKRYYEETYADEIESFKGSQLLQAYGEEYFQTSANDYLVVMPEKLAFTDHISESNLKAFKEEDSMSLGKFDYNSVTIDYFETAIDVQVRDEFTLFVREFAAAMDRIMFLKQKTAHLIPEEYIQRQLGKLLNGQEISADKVITVIKWFDEKNVIVNSLIEGKQLSTREIIESIIKALNQKELAKLINMWTGSALFNYQTATLNIQMLDSTSLPYEMTLLNASTLERPKYEVIAPGEGYRDFLRRVYEQQCMILNIVADGGPDYLHKDHFSKIHSTHSSTCASEIRIVRQSATKMVQSFADFLNSPLGFRDVTVVLPAREERV